MQIHLALILTAVSAGGASTPVPLDLDGDGRLDLALLDGEGTAHLLRNDGAAGFVEAAASGGLPGGLSALFWRDLDADGDPDLLALGQEGPRLYENLGAFTFAEVPAAGGLQSAVPRGEPAWIDLDADGGSDLLWTGTGVQVFRQARALAFVPAGTVEFAPRRMLAENPALVPEDDASQAATLGATLGGASSTGNRSAAAASGICAGSLFDSTLGGCLEASGVPTLGELYPLSSDLNVDLAGNVGMGTTSPSEKLDVAGVVRAAGGLRFGDGTLQTSAGTKQWSQLSGVPAGFADGIDNDTQYAAGLGLTLVSGLFGFDTAFGDARYWNESQLLNGDLSGTAGNALVDGLQGRAVSAAPPLTNQVLKWNGAAWAPAIDLDSNTTYGAGTGLALAGTTFSVANAGVDSAQLASNAASLEKVTGGAASLSSGRVMVNTTIPSGRLTLRHPSSTGNSHLSLVQQAGAGSYTRIGMSNESSAQTWTIAGGLTAAPATDEINFFHSTAGNVLSIGGDGRVGVDTTDPLTALHVVGSLHLQGTSQDISVQSGEQLQIGHFDGTTFSERMRIDGTGVVHTSGDLVVGGELSIPATTRWLSLSGADFEPVTPATAITQNALGCFVEPALPSLPLAPLRAVAPIHLPDGAVIGEVLVHFDDSSPSLNASLELLRKGVGLAAFPESMASVSSLGSSGLQVRKTSAVAYAMTDAAGYAYYLVFNAQVPADGGFFSLYEVRITYSVVTPLP